MIVVVGVELMNSIIVVPQMTIHMVIFQFAIESSFYKGYNNGGIYIDASIVYIYILIYNSDP